VDPLRLLLLPGIERRRNAVPAAAPAAGPRLPLAAAFLAVAGCLAFEAPAFAEPAAHFGRGLELFEEARAYGRERPSERLEIARRYRQAAESFAAAWREGAVSSRVFTNAANSYFFAGDHGEAVRFYRRALLADPSNAAARSGLEHIRESLPIRRQLSGAASFWASLFFWHDERSFHWRLLAFQVFFPAAWILLAVEIGRRRWPRTQLLLVAVAPLALAALALSYLFRPRRPFAAVGLACMLPALVAFSSLAVESASADATREGVILVETEGRRGDGESYSPSHTRPFPPGTEVTIREERPGTRGGWLRVELLDGSESWVPQAAVGRLIE
jgi:tetratricopeptide (TPR) repeat protein